ncbi:putative porin [Nicoletella semolina]|uniref:Putative porin n=1 Tax=Nicoletella semolina TaxID=271160 RepID=A0A4R2N996_9PAST|nr:porin [Nicoletella semolina]MDH2925506.1 hypothetical protein [Nicoletella semolina]TCP17581.1 putative porin [Nicoletella semolina]
MKKTLVALAVTAFAASASAVTLYEKDGTEVKFDGSVRLLLSKSSETEGRKTTDKHSTLKNDGSRVGVSVNQKLDNGLYALARAELRLNNAANDAHGFGGVKAHRAYVGLGKKELGQVTFGNQVTAADGVGQASFANAFGVDSSALTTSGASVLRYEYKGVEGLKLGASYSFAADRTKNEVTVGKVQNGYALGGSYEFDGFTVAAGYSRDNFKTGQFKEKEDGVEKAYVTGKKYYKEGFQVGLAKEIDKLTLAFNTGTQVVVGKNGNSKETLVFLTPSVKLAVTDKVSVYADYDYSRKTEKGSLDKTKTHGVAVGSSYKLHKNVFTFVEGSLSREKTGQQDKKIARNIGAGVRVSW